MANLSNHTAGLLRKPYSTEALFFLFLVFSGVVVSCGSGGGDTSQEIASTDTTGDGGINDAGDFGSDGQDAGTGDSDSDIPGEVCAELSRAYGVTYCAHTISDEETWDALAVYAGGLEAITATKYVMGADDTLQVPLTFMNVNIHRLHYEFLVTAFPDLFEGISPVQYLDMAMDGETRRLMVGTIALYASEDEPFYGFTVLDDTNSSEKVIRFEQVLHLYQELSSHFSLGELSFVPETSAQMAAAATWPATFPIAGVDNQVDYEVYTSGQGFGTVRLMDLAQLAQANASGEIGFQDILVLDEAPSDLERVVSGTVTGTRQGVLSHLNVRSSARGTPNCFVRNPQETLGEWEGRLVRIVCGESELEIQEATVEEAEAAWNALRPEPVTVRPMDTAFDALFPLLSIPTDSADERATATQRFGAKASNLAILYQRIDPSLQLSGFAVPFFYYNQFMETNQWVVETGAGTRELSFSDTVDTWLDEPAFTSDALLRRTRLVALQEAMNAATVDVGLIDALENAIIDVFGADDVMVRFRSSSNAEDALSFSGAGLYDSTRACLADETDGDVTGPSHCDADEKKEQDISSALKQVWASLWNPAAFEERAWYGIDHRLVGMGILVNTRTKGEAADIVAFSGNPITGAHDYLINAQVGDWDVVSSEPGVFPETTLLEINGIEVAAIHRVSASSQVSPQETVLSDAQLTTLGAHLADIASLFPLDVSLPDDAVLFYDTEWKLTADNTLIVKQIRPYLYQADDRASF
jgi:hypothetical protein